MQVGLPGEKLAGALYSGSSGAGMECMKCRNTRERAEPAYDVMVTVRKCFPVVSATAAASCTVKHDRPACFVMW